MHALLRPVSMLFLAAFLTVPAAWGKTPSDRSEKAIVAYVKTRQEPAVALLEKAVNINSGTMNFAGVRAVGDLFRPHFDALGFRTEWVDGAAFGRAGHLVAERKGKRGPHVLLIGHLDTVFEPDHPFQKFERIDSNIVRGPGTSDMKGGIVVALTALEALRKVGALDKLNITVVCTGTRKTPVHRWPQHVKRSSKPQRLPTSQSDWKTPPTTRRLP